ncbi:Nif3-like dinuclear metal center hexameric protein [Synechococcus sp. BA-124 BA4]|jgi:putative NIF3 family GTP cyclohydrolase 1 type 2|nr:Nif3-like dinuclear metal center hexameric protein [Synechococcus sp. BA-124 BA4]MEA5400745.1 Nif3-like dinuclear metal center hexameric protein [Synechococcus sp. BA-124 BA4]CAK6686931.1 hypothetical protein BBFGKLBO_00111 [Synechococcus sp. CBW1107]
MKSLQEVICSLDSFFSYSDYPDSIIDTLVRTDMKAFLRFNEDYFRKTSGLMIQNSLHISSICCAAFPSNDLISHIEKVTNALLLVKHPMDWNEFSEGFIPISEKFLNKLKDRKISLYCAHSAHDNHLSCSPSVGLAQVFNGDILEIMSDEQDRVFGCIVEIQNPLRFEDLRLFLSQTFGLISFQEYFVHDRVHRIAVVAGGGDNPQWLNLAIGKNCDTYLTGILYFRGSQYAKENNPIFIRNLKASSLNALGISHYFSEQRGSILLANLLARVVKLPTKYLPEMGKAKLIQCNWQLHI